MTLLFILVSTFGCMNTDPPVADSDTESESASEEMSSDASNEESNGENNDESKPSEGGEEEPEEKLYLLNSHTAGVKVLGVRHLESDYQLNCDWTGSGLEMNIVHGGGDIVFFGNCSDPCYFRAYIDGEEWNNGPTAYYELSSANRKLTIRNVPAGEHTLKLIKVTGYTLSRAELLSVTFKGTIKEEAPADKELLIEFVGDSISCGWGTIGGHGGAYTDQDGTLAYPLKIAEALNADYSVTALSGQGLLMGNPGMTEGYLYGSALRNKNQYYSFERQADIVVINIGTNDFHYSTQQGITEAAFKISYKNFLKKVRQKNGEDCKILCLYNTMNDTYQNALLAAVEEVGGEAAGIYTYKTYQTQGHLHPNISEHQSLTNSILERIRQIMA